MAYDSVFKRSKVIKQPRAADKGQQIRYALRRARKHKKKWPEPDDAFLILNLHFSVKTFSRMSFHADATLEIPTKDGFAYFSVSKGDKTEAGALRSVIAEVENSTWFKYMKSRKVYFQITGSGMETLYRGYL